MSLLRAGAGRPVDATASGAFTPASLTGLVAWYKADTGVFVDAGSTLATNGQTVQQWNDQSGNGYHLKQATGGSRPTFQTAGFNSSFPAVTFTLSSSTWMATTANTVAMGTGLVGSAFLVGLITGSGAVNARGVAYVENGQTADTISSHSAAWLLLSPGTPSLASYRAGFFANDNVAIFNVNMRVGNVYDNTNDTGYLNNVAGTPVAASGLTWTSPGTLLISTADTASPTAFWDGPIAEVVVTNTALSGTDRTNLDNYFKTNLGL